MYTLIRSNPWRKNLTEQLPALAVAFLLAERFYKFHSFTLECGAFLATWFACDAAVQGVRSLTKAARGAPVPAAAD